MPNLKNLLLIKFIAILFATFNISNIKIEYLSSFFPLFDVMIIYYFAVLKPDIFPIWFLFLLGIIKDSLTGIPLGITSLCYIIIVKLFCRLNNKIDTQENFVQTLKQFICFVLAIIILKWLILSIYHLQFYNIINPAVQAALTCVIYVLMHRFFNYLDKKLLDA